MQSGSLIEQSAHGPTTGHPPVRRGAPCGSPFPRNWHNNRPAGTLRHNRRSPPPATARPALQHLLSQPIGAAPLVGALPRLRVPKYSSRKPEHSQPSLDACTPPSDNGLPPAFPSASGPVVLPQMNRPRCGLPPAPLQEAGMSTALPVSLAR